MFTFCTPSMFLRHSTGHKYGSCFEVFYHRNLKYFTAFLFVSVDFPASVHSLNIDERFSNYSDQAVNH